MIYCICRQLNTTKVDEAITSGARSARSVMAHHGTRFNCGKCKSTIEERLAATSVPACVANAPQGAQTPRPASTGTVLFAAE